ncbi:hypothetical protein QBC38DRAFT_444105 [Podospora fimiseda]|uniref:Uncharacterized protein n=1 Tax=Podospora fimiseda TaxID=252190 RepID=A0AAN7BPE2_9PEZI|nr:hypothetical protein QBC38DRAFT_444105 [Podospora fimiseda]
MGNTLAKHHQHPTQRKLRQRSPESNFIMSSTPPKDQQSQTTDSNTQQSAKASDPPRSTTSGEVLSLFPPGLLAQAAERGGNAGESAGSVRAAPSQRQKKPATQSTNTTRTTDDLSYIMSRQEVTDFRSKNYRDRRDPAKIVSDERRSRSPPLKIGPAYFSRDSAGLSSWSSNQVGESEFKSEVEDTSKAPEPSKPELGVITLAALFFLLSFFFNFSFWFYERSSESM